MRKLQGLYTNANIYATVLEDEALKQIQELIDKPQYTGESVAIMADAHAGAGCVIGFTSTTNNNNIDPRLIGVDIACGVINLNLGQLEVDFAQLDNFIRANFSGYVQPNISMEVLEMSRELVQLVNIGDEARQNYHANQMGTLGGGNHYIELGQASNGDIWLSVHTGSRNFGHTVASHYIAQGEFLSEEQSVLYKEHSQLVNQWANLNRQVIANAIVEFLGAEVQEKVQTIHNYIDANGIIRKGAVSAQENELLVIPISMKEGVLLARGLGNPEANHSSAHGAGRLMARGAAKRNLSLEEFQQQMEGIWTSCVSENTLDEAPMAYKSLEQIQEGLNETVEVVDRILPIYNFKN